MEKWKSYDADTPESLKKVYRKKRLIFVVQCFLGLLLAGFVSYMLYSGYLMQEASKEQMIKNKKIKEQLRASNVRKSEEKEQELRVRVSLDIAEGERLVSEKEYKEGIKLLYYASTVFPKDMEPHFALIKACNKACDDNESYCGNAQKRIKQAYDLAENYHKSNFYKEKVDKLAVTWSQIMKKKK